MGIGHEVIERCRRLAAYTEEPGFITRTFLSEPMHRVHADLRAVRNLLDANDDVHGHSFLR